MCYGKRAHAVGTAGRSLQLISGGSAKGRVSGSRKVLSSARARVCVCAGTRGPDRRDCGSGMILQMQPRLGCGKPSEPCVVVL